MDILPAKYKHKYRDSSLAMCLEFTREAVTDLYDFAEPKFVQGMTGVQERIPSIGSVQCSNTRTAGTSSRSTGMGGCTTSASSKDKSRRSKSTSRSTTRTRRASWQRQTQTQPSRRTHRSRSSDSGSSTSETYQLSRDEEESAGSVSTFDDIMMDDPNSKSAPPTKQITATTFWQKPFQSQSWMSWDKTDSTGLKDDFMTKRGRTTRGRSPTRRSNSMNSGRNRIQQQHLESIRRAKSANPRLVSLLNLKNVENGTGQDVSATGPTTAEDDAMMPTVVTSSKQKATLSRRHSSGLEYDTQPTTTVGMEADPQDSLQNNRLKRGTFRQSSFGKDDEDADDTNIDNGTEVEPYQQQRASSTQEVGLVSHPSYAPSHIGSQGMDTILVRNSGNMHHTSTANKGSNRDGLVTPPPITKPQNAIQPQPPLRLETNQEDMSPVSFVVPTSRSTPKEVAPSLVSHVHHGNDVAIVVGTGAEQQIFYYNSHVLLYISDYFSHIMRPAHNNSNSNTTAIGDAKWKIDFTHKRVPEWEIFYPFLAPPVKRTVSLDIFNLPVLLPWFHEFQLPLLMHQCDVMLSSLVFRHYETAQTDDLQDVLLLLYTALSCDLPQAQDLGITVIESYLKHAPQLFLQHSAIQRLIILLQCFPHFQQQLWFSSIRSYLPVDLDLCCDVNTRSGRDELLQNPLFSFLLREGFNKAKAKARTRHYLKHKQRIKSRIAAAEGKETFVTTNTTKASASPSWAAEAHKEEFDDDAPNGDSHSMTPTETFMEELSGMTPQERPGSLATTVNKKSKGEDRLEMTLDLGEQFWGPGWDQEPRLSREQEQRQQDRRQWLEDIVEMLKEQAKQERNKVREVQQKQQQLACPPVQPNLIIPPYRNQNTQQQQQQQQQRCAQAPSIASTVNPVVRSASRLDSTTTGLNHVSQQMIMTRKTKEMRDASPDMTISTTEPSSVGDVNSTESSKRTFAC